MRVRTALIGAFVVALFALPAGGALSASESQTYIVQMLDAPAVALRRWRLRHPGDQAGQGQEDQSGGRNVQRYRDHLKGKHDQALQRVGGGEKLYDYGVTFNGFAAVLTEAQAEEMKAAKDVVSVTPDRVDAVETSTTPAFLGLSGSGGFWQSTGAVGEDVVIGVLDTGYWPENHAYSDRSRRNPTGRPNGPKDYKKLKDWHGDCEAGEQFTKQTCNNKVVGARFFTEGALASGGIPDFEFLSPRDWDGHGSHTSSTAGGRTTSSRPVTPPASRRSAAWLRGHASRSTRCAGSCPTRAPRAARRPTASPRSTRASRTASTS